MDEFLAHHQQRYPQETRTTLTTFVFVPWRACANDVPITHSKRMTEIELRELPGRLRSAHTAAAGEPHYSLIRRIPVEAYERPTADCSFGRRTTVVDSNERIRSSRASDEGPLTEHQLGCK
uniref:hypothetical protein n=1 Tax=Polaromonas sp. W11N TaxID=1840303 RepID=UPI0015E7EA47|nr:hypothetical protein [Polaromonas sp. W11N]